ncbi:hypothetical protein LZ31DRAFT_249125 [Colletotrichum somersetense]|nr:hypothetical protein LZ31DRAFT_249125 [Colletotrichum somersetense]
MTYPHFLSSHLRPKFVSCVLPLHFLIHWPCHSGASMTGCDPRFPSVSQWGWAGREGNGRREKTVQSSSPNPRGLTSTHTGRFSPPEGEKVREVGFGDVRQTTTGGRQRQFLPICISKCSPPLGINTLPCPLS